MEKTYSDWTDVSWQILLAIKADKRRLAGSDICHYVRVFTALKTLFPEKYIKLLTDGC